MKKTSSISKDDSNLSKSHFGYFRHSLVNFKNLIILFWNIWVCMVHEKVKRCCVWFGTYKKQFVICDPESLNSIPVSGFDVFFAYLVF